MNLDGISILFCSVFMLFRPNFVMFSDNSKTIFLQFYTGFEFLHPIFDVFSQYMRAIAFLLLYYFQSIFIVFANTSILLNFETH